MYDEATILAAYAALRAAGDDQGCAHIRALVEAGYVRPSSPAPRPERGTAPEQSWRTVPVTRR